MSKESNKNDNAASCIQYLWEEGFFKDVCTMRDVSTRITEKWEHNFSAPDISKALHGAGFLTRSGKRGSFQYKQKTSPKSKKIESIEEQLFSHELITKLGDRFKTEIDDLHLNFGRSGICTAFLLRKILEKAIFLVFAKSGLSAKLEDGSGTGKLIGLEAMVDAAAREKIGGVSILIPKTADKIKGIKFLGDVSAHNPLTNVDMETILPQMPYIITAYKELAERL
ncbi:MAG: hypothetical protein NUV84_02275 [Candidatus Uhrbacteria bacterium]|nr:hypothetical protein [Candidatus Uhrbacteria bacterium]